jgi:hypothetical protein
LAHFCLRQILWLKLYTSLKSNSELQVSILNNVNRPALDPQIAAFNRTTKRQLRLDTIKHTTWHLASVFKEVRLHWGNSRFRASVTDSMGVIGPGRCFPFWQEVLGCYVVNTSAEDDSGKKKCAGALEDYYECLHHKKEVRDCAP